MYNILRHAHSGFRWIVLLLILAAIINALMKMSSKKFTKTDKTLNLLAMTTTHIQFIIGVVLLFLSPKVKFGSEMMSNDLYRFFTMEHTLMMLIGIALITIGYGKAKRSSEDKDKFKKTAIFYGIGLLFILSRIPWPFLTKYGGSWF